MGLREDRTRARTNSRGGKAFTAIASLVVLASLLLGVDAVEAETFVSLHVEPEMGKVGTSYIYVFDDGPGAAGAPVREFWDSTTPLVGVGRLALHPSVPEVVVADSPKADIPSKILTYDSLSVGDSVPIRGIQGSSTGLTNLTGVILDWKNDEILVLNERQVDNFPAEPLTVVELLAFDRFADGDVAPLRVLQLAPIRHLQAFLQVETDELFVANGTSINVYHRTATTMDAPMRSIVGPSTGLADVFGVFVDTDADVVYAMSADELRTFPASSSGDVGPLNVYSPSDGFWSSFFVSNTNELHAVTQFGAQTQLRVFPLSTAGPIAASYSLAIGPDTDHIGVAGTEAAGGGVGYAAPGTTESPLEVPISSGATVILVVLLLLAGILRID